MNRYKLVLPYLLILFLAACFGRTSAPDTYTASGVVKDANDSPVEAVTLVFDGYGTAQTNEQGEWQKSGLKGNVTVIPVKEGYVFDPPSHTVTPTFAKQVMFVGHATSLSISPTEATLQVDDTLEFAAIGRDKYGQPVAVNPVWIVTGGIGIAAPGQGPSTIFTATAPGEGTVAAEDDDMVVYAVVRVVPRQEEYDFYVTHDINSTPVDGVGGKVTAVVDDQAYVYGINVTLTATPAQGWRFVGWKGDFESEDPTVELAVIDPEREPIHPFGAAFSGGKSRIVWDWDWGDHPNPTYHPEIVEYGDSMTGYSSRTTAGQMLEAKFVSRPIRAVFEKE